MSPEECLGRRSRLALTRESLARLAGVAERTIRMLEEGRVSPRPTTLVALRRGFRLAEQSSSGET
jgi:DNA-binding XRE family transcriptional regulator